MEKEIMILLKEIRKKNNISLKSVADALNVSLATMYQFESENTTRSQNLTLSVFFKWCDALGKKPQVVIGTIYERKHPRSHISKQKRVEMLLKKSFGDLTEEEKIFLQKNV